MRTRRELLQNLGLALSAMTVASCAREGAPASSSSTGRLLWNRAAFGPRPGDLERFHLESFLEEQLHPEGIDDFACQERLRQMEFETMEKSKQELWDDHYLAQDEAVSDEDYDWVMLPYYETVQATMLRAVYSKRQLHEVMADFWHNHFNVYGAHDDVSPLLTSYDRDAIRPHVLGNFGRMLRSVAAHPVMLMYLSNNSNEVGGTNENYARELLELHTLGAMNYKGTMTPQLVELDRNGLARAYVDNDVYEVARCFTGWTLDESDNDNTVGGTGKFVCLAESHDRFNKVVLGRYLRSDQGVLKDCETVLEMLANHPGTARHIATKLCRRLVADQPPPALVERAADLFYGKRDSDDQIRQVVGMILRSSEFQQSMGGKVKRPFELAVSLLRALEIDFQADDEFMELFDAMGQPLFGRATPDGYPDVAPAWLHTSSLVYRWRLVQKLVQRARLDPSVSAAQWSHRLLGQTREPALLATVKDPKDQVALLAMSPEFQLR